MKLKEHYGLIAVLIILLYYLGHVVLQFLKYRTMGLVVSYGNLYYLFVLFLLFAILSIFIAFRFNWIVTALPFLWLLASPFYNPTNPSDKMGYLFQFFTPLFQGTFMFLTFVSVLLYSIIICYLILLNTREISKRTDYYFAAIIILLPIAQKIIFELFY